MNNIKYLIMISFILIFISSCDQEHKHSIRDKWYYDSAYHWYECEYCDELLEIELHKYAEDGNVCIVCGFCKKEVTEEPEDQIYVEKVEIDGILYDKETRITYANNQINYEYSYSIAGVFKKKTIETYDEDTNILRYKYYSEEKEDGSYYESYCYDENGTLVQEDKSLNCIAYYSKRYMYDGEYYLTIVETSFDEKGNKQFETFTNYNIIGEIISIRKEEETLNEYGYKVITITEYDSDVMFVSKTRHQILESNAKIYKSLTQNLNEFDYVENETLSIFHYDDNGNLYCSEAYYNNVLGSRFNYTFDENNKMIKNYNVYYGRDSIIYKEEYNFYKNEQLYKYVIVDYLFDSEGNYLYGRKVTYKDGNNQITKTETEYLKDGEYKKIEG